MSGNEGADHLMRTVSAGAVDAADVALEQEGEPGINLHLAGVRINAGLK